MGWRSRARSVLAVLTLVLALKVGQELYRWIAFADERSRLRALAGTLDSAGVGAVRARVRADSLRRDIEAMDRQLDGVRAALAPYERRAVDGAIPEALYPAYRARLDDYNRAVRRRNVRLAAWREAVEASRAALGRYEVVADSMRALAEAMGDPYYQVPSPVEVATRHGLAPPGARPRQP